MSDTPTPEAMAAAKRIITRADPYIDRERAARIIDEEFAAVMADVERYRRAFGHTFVSDESDEHREKCKSCGQSEL